MPKYSYDLKCKELAEHFLQDTAYRGNEDCAINLAQIIQDAVEDYLAGNEPGGVPAVVRFLKEKRYDR